MSLPPPPKTAADGRERFGRNVAFAWGGYMVNVVSGFIVPRLISDHLGQATLGIWDFSWSFVSYFGLVQLGMGGSISRYVAYYRAKGDIVGLNRSVSTIAVFQRSVGWLSLIVAIACTLWVMPLFAGKFGEELPIASWVILLLGTEVALTTTLAAYGAVVVGCHRWDLTNSVNAIAYAVSAMGMIAVLLLGGGLPSLALIHCGCMVGAELVRWRLSKLVCPELIIKREFASWKTFCDQARFSAKTLIPSITDLFSNQAMSLLITAFLGPASLAVFSRSRSLMTTLRTLSAKFGMIMIPTASAMQAKNDREALKDILLVKPAIISSLMLPVLICMAVMGNQLIKAWMGEAYVERGLLPILVLGTFATLVQEPIWCLLTGMNVHGRVAVAKLVTGVLSSGLMLIGLWNFHWGLLGAAVCFVLPGLVVDGLVTPWFACGVVGVSKLEFLWKTYLRPLLCVVPFGSMLWIASKLARCDLSLALLILMAGIMMTGLAYFKWLLPIRIPARIIGLIRKLLPKCGVENCW